MDSTPSGAGAGDPAPRVPTTTTAASSASSAAPTGSATIRYERRGSGPVSSLPGISTKIAKRNSTMMAPAYTATCATARNWAPSMR